MEEFDYRIGDLNLRNGGRVDQLDTINDFGDDRLLKFEIEASIAEIIKPKDVIEALERLDGAELGANQVSIKVANLRLLCSFVAPKADIYAMGKVPNETVDVTRQFLGTIYVSRDRRVPCAKAEDTSWQKMPSFKEFRRAKPIGARMNGDQREQWSFIQEHE